MNMFVYLTSLSRLTLTLLVPFLRNPPNSKLPSLCFLFEAEKNKYWLESSFCIIYVFFFVSFCLDLMIFNCSMTKIWSLSLVYLFRFQFFLISFFGFSLFPFCSWVDIFGSLLFWYNLKYPFEFTAYFSLFVFFFSFGY